MISETMGFKSQAYIIMPKLTDLHCNAEMQAIFQHLHQKAETRHDSRIKGSSALTCYLCNNCLGNPPIGKKGFDFLFYHTAVPPNKNRRQDQQCMLKVEILIFAKKGEAERWGEHRKDTKIKVNRPNLCENMKLKETKKTPHIQVLKHHPIRQTL